MIRSLGLPRLDYTITSATWRHWLRLSVLVPVALGVFLSFSYANSGEALGETGRAALSLADLGYIGNPYASPTGPTAHVSPVGTMMVALVLKLFGGNSTTARIVLSLTVTLLYSINCWLVIQICELCGVRKWGVFLAICLTSLVPTFLYKVVIACRYWDQPLGATILCVALYVLLDALRNDRSAYVPEVCLATLAGLGCLTSPVVLPSIVGALAVLIFRRRERTRPFYVSGLAAVIMAILIVPWGIRNELMLGKFIVTRSNLGLELEMGNHDGATGTPDHNEPLHPYASEAAAARLSQIGEVRYMAEMQQLATKWMWTHPTATLKLTVRRLRLLLFPDRTMVWWSPVLHNATWYWLLAYGVLWLAALIRVLISGPMRGIWLLFVILPLAPYAITQVELRYTYIAFFPSVCLIAVGLFGAIGRREIEARPGWRHPGSPHARIASAIRAS